MICAICGHREAVVFMRRSDRGESGETALCEDCARERGLSAGRGRIELRLEDLLSGLPSSTAAVPLACPQCGRDLDELRREGRIGCGNCATVFRAEIERWLRVRARPPYWVPEPGSGKDGSSADSEGKAASEAGAARVARADAELAAALADEDYEKAALLRDRLRSASPGPEAGGRGAGSALTMALEALHDYPVFAAVASGSTAGLLPGGPDGIGEAFPSDIVLESAARISRNLSGLVFPGPRAKPSIEAFTGGLPPGSRLYRLGALAEGERGALVEAGFIPRSSALAGEGVVVLSGTSPWLASFDTEDHLRVHARLPGLALVEASDAALGAIDSLGGSREGFFAFDEDFGWLSSRLSELGTGATMRVLLHLPALALTGLLERVFRGLLSRGLAVRGYYGGDEGSAGDLYEVSTDRGFGQSTRALARELSETALQVARAEAKARSGLGPRRDGEIADRAGRALGLFRYCRYLAEAEAASGLSALALAASLGIARGAECRSLALLAGRLGAGNMAVAGFPARRDRREEEAARARMVRAAVRMIEIDEAATGPERPEGGG